MAQASATSSATSSSNAASPAASKTVLYVLAASSNSMGIRALVEDYKLPFEVKVLDARKGETRTPEFRAKNPYHCAPTLEELDSNGKSSFVLWESNAILRYVCSTHQIPLYPSEPRIRAKVEQALDWRQTVLAPAVSSLVYPALGFGNPVSDAESKAQAQKVLEIILDFQRYYIAGGKFVNDQPSLTIADLAITPLFYLLEFMVQQKHFKIPAEAAAYVARVEKASPGLLLARQPWDGFLKSFFASTAAAAAAAAAAASSPSSSSSSPASPLPKPAASPSSPAPSAAAGAPSSSPSASRTTTTTTSS